MQPCLAHPPPLGRRLRIQAQVSKDLLDHRPLLDGGDDLKLTASLPAELPISLEIPSDCRLLELGPEHGTRKVRASSQVVAVTI